MNGLNFVTQTHEGRSRTVICQANMINNLYPNDTFYVYDGGLNDRSRKELSKISNTEILNWREKADFSTNVGRLEHILAQLESKAKNNIYLDHVLRKVFGYNYKYSDVIRWDFYMRQKPLCIMDLTDRVDGNIFWMDDDAVIINRIDEIFDHDFDFGATIRSLYVERNSGMPPVNAGVLVFNTYSDIIQEIVKKWLEIIDNSELSTHREQNAIESMLLNSNENIFDNYYNSGTTSFGSSKITTRVFPCRKYNYSYFKNGIYPSENKILHLKGGALGDNINKKLINDIDNDKIDDWNRGYPLRNDDIQY